MVTSRKCSIQKRFPRLAVDGIITKNKEILLVKRNVYPFRGYWTLPGGHIEYGETVEQAIGREIKEELNLTIKIKQLIGIFSGPRRDPRYHLISISYWLQIISGNIRLNQEANQFAYFPLNKLPPKIGADHRQIIEQFKKQYIKNKKLIKNQNVRH
ncbi:MAG: NUDIX hydrolase [Candidatus Aenigmarchaeota archaeon]|nr:NUDIX hydrolase [Candidatus Aenigmarchaeota archaeon]